MVMSFSPCDMNVITIIIKTVGFLKQIELFESKTEFHIARCRKKYVFFKSKYSFKLYRLC